MAKSTSARTSGADPGGPARRAAVTPAVSAPADAARAPGKRVVRARAVKATPSPPAGAKRSPKRSAKRAAPADAEPLTEPAASAEPTQAAAKPAEPTQAATRSAAQARASRQQGKIPASLALGEADGVGPTGRPRRTFPTPAPLDRHGPARILAMCNQKGGVGKTTSTINLGAALAEAGRTVLLVDFDPQGALSVGLGVNPLQLDQTIYNLLMERDITVQDVMLKTDIAGLDLLPSNIDLSAAEVQLVNEVAREQTLRRVLGPVVDDYDVVLIDCQPSLGLLTVNALTASDGVIIPLECEYFALRGVALLITTIEKVRERLNPDLEVEGLLAMMYDSRTLHGREVLTRLVEAFGEKVFHTVINRTVRFPETTVAGEPITTYASSSLGARAYRDLARELLARTPARAAGALR